MSEMPTLEGVVALISHSRRSGTNTLTRHQ